MYHELLRDVRFFSSLLKFDRDLADEVRARRCAHCGARLDGGHYLRKPRGGPPGLDPGFRMRFSFSCAARDCRKRAKPPSLRFLGRRHYLGAVVILVSAMEGGITEKRVAELQRLLDAPIAARTLGRWRAWWRETFVLTKFWIAQRSRFSPPVDASRIPASLLERFAGAHRDRLLWLLRFLAPLSSPSTAMGL